jgi:xanthine dehydrogenase YagS FAD-binding subunit
VNRFSYLRADSVAHAIRLAADDPGAAFIAGGTNLLDLMKGSVVRPRCLIDIRELPLHRIEDLPDRGLRLGALVSNTEAAYDERVAHRHPILARAILAGASPRLRNVATVGGNLLQRTRCYYFYDLSTACNKREPGSGCGALHGVNRIHAILGTTESCIATHPSDMCVALSTLDAIVQVTGPFGPRTSPFATFHRLPGDTPHLDTNLERGELVTSVDLPARGFADHFAYVKVRDRAS